MLINLVPDIVQQRRREAAIKSTATLALVGWFFLVGLLAISALGYRIVEQGIYNSAKKTYDADNAKVNSADNVVFRTEALAVQNSLQQLSTLFASEHKFSTIFTALSKLTPTNVRLGGVNIKDTNGVDVTGTAPTYQDVSKFLAALKAADPTQSNTGQQSSATTNQLYFTNLSFQGANQADTGVNFSLSLTYMQPTDNSGSSK